MRETITTVALQWAAIIILLLTAWPVVAAESEPELRFSKRGVATFEDWKVTRIVSMLNDEVTHTAITEGQLVQGQSESGTVATLIVRCNIGNWWKIHVGFQHLNVAWNLEKRWTGDYYKSARLVFRLNMGRAYGQEVVVDPGKDVVRFYSNSENTQRKHVRRFEGLQTIHMGVDQYRGTQWFEFSMRGYDGAIAELRHRCRVK